MDRSRLPLNALRAFEASARHLSFTRAAIELCVTQAAVSHQVKRLEEMLKVSLFRRLPRGLLITEEGLSLLPVVRDVFDRIGSALDRFEGGQAREVLTVGAVGTFAVGWLLPRLTDFASHASFVDLRLSTNNNRVDIAAEGLDFAIRFGSGAWHGLDASELFVARLSVLCNPDIAAQLSSPDEVMRHTLLMSYRSDEWPKWFAAAGVQNPPSPLRGMVFDSSLSMMEAAIQGAGVALAPPLMFDRQLAAGTIVQPFPYLISTGSYWLTRLQSKEPTPAMDAFRAWILAQSQSQVARA
ncbi:LysR family transcriptional activator AmpR (plasmid) [Rhizobium etli 8C-3]|uniref:LysR family transcriptional regulator of beta-lactamase n=2 Tax=Rhizobium TaxID=379 RepID=A0A4R3R7N8_9HYPH|nr:MULTISPECIES: LysR family transcriptional regulator [Rhizobium]APO78299.1 LysR family transcriptional activator AmpR [Rhizobium etli 8C-3]TCU31258.1 LysR family transcriptional regulator of beta-lactamase [Rhizobium azibense]TCU40732.1 LysR family transcriptional regulator of beta-lactamase [Rhizobium azibense]